jgi:hypothetical protein
MNAEMSIGLPDAYSENEQISPDKLVLIDLDADDSGFASSKTRKQKSKPADSASNNNSILRSSPFASC